MGWGIALSDDNATCGQNFQACLSFDTAKPQKPLWQFNCEQCQIGDDVKGGVDISGDGSKLLLLFGEKSGAFDKSSNKPIWSIFRRGNSYNVAISKDGKYIWQQPRPVRKQMLIQT